MKKEKPRASEVKKLQKALVEEKEKSKEYLNRLKYLQADFENYRKRVDKEIYEVARISNEKLIVNLLGIIDELELALRSGQETENKQALLEGVQMTLKKLYATLGQEGLARIETIGKPFDPKLHEVVTRVPAEEYEKHVIVEEIRTGYMFRDKVIRPSLVKIATRKGDDS